MKYLKAFENLQETPKIGDYVLINTNSTVPGIQDFINNTIGEIGEIQEDKKDPFWNKTIEGFILVKYNNIPIDLRSWFGYGQFNGMNTFFRQFQMNQVVAFSKSKKELEHIIIANKYNL